MIFFGLIVVIFFIILIIFTFPQFSPIPYFPSNKKDLPLIIKALDLKNNQVVIDLGAGDGLIIFEAAKRAYKKRLNTQFIAVDINPVLILILHIRQLFHHNKRNIRIIRDDMFNINFNKNITMKQFNNITIYLYISPWYLEKTLVNIKKQSASWRKNFKIVSYMYPIKTLETNETVISGKNKIYYYVIK